VNILNPSGHGNSEKKKDDDVLCKHGRYGDGGERRWEWEGAAKKGKGEKDESGRSGKGRIVSEGGGGGPTRYGLGGRREGRCGFRRGWEGRYGGDKRRLQDKAPYCGFFSAMGENTTMADGTVETGNNFVCRRK